MTDSIIEIWRPRKGVLGRARTAELPVADLSMFGASVFANKSDRIARGQVLGVSLGPTKATAIVRSEQPSGDGDGRLRYGLEFINPTDDFLAEVGLITETCRRIAGEHAGQEQLWLRTS